jgi:hypothetical protein
LLAPRAVGGGDGNVRNVSVDGWRDRGNDQVGQRTADCDRDPVQPVQAQVSPVDRDRLGPAQAGEQEEEAAPGMLKLLTG